MHDRFQRLDVQQVMLLSRQDQSLHVPSHIDEVARAARQGA